MSSDTTEVGYAAREAGRSEGGGDVPDERTAAAPDPAESGDGTASEGEVASAIALLESLAESPERLARLDAQALTRLRTAAGRLALPDRLARRRFARAQRRLEERRKKAQDDAAFEGTSNRARKRALAFPVPPADAALDDRARGLLEVQARSRRVDADRHKLHASRSCYVCKRDYRRLHPHYDTMCPECAAFNWEKRTQTADLRGRVALVTGARVKIGFEIALMLLRAGARVIATTRFVRDAARRFEAVSDFSTWRERLELVPLDLRDTPALERFCDELGRRERWLDYVLHNACQTVRRPPAYYAEMVDAERRAGLSADAEALIGGGPERHALVTVESEGDVAALSTLDLLGEADLAPLFPAGIRDGDGQPLDLRETNSWRLDLHEVTTIELIEVQLVNAIAPFVLNARLKPLLLASPRESRHIVHVSAMEGQFYRTFKTTRHPHTNMAKAALNMMTRTSAADFARDGIYMNSVDTGWVTDEDPFEKTVAKEMAQRFAPPLDAVDGAARVLDPIFTGVQTGRHCWGQFLKDYRPTRW